MIKGQLSLSGYLVSIKKKKEKEKKLQLAPDYLNPQGNSNDLSYRG